jgi:hypothetical protein
MLKTRFLHQYLQHLGLENFFSHHYLYQKTFYFPNLGATITQLIIFPIEKSLHEFIFLNFFRARIFFFCFPCSIFLFASPPQHFSNGPPLMRPYIKNWTSREKTRSELIGLFGIRIGLV